MRLKKVFDPTQWETKPLIYSLPLVYALFAIRSSIDDHFSHARHTLPQKWHLHPTLPQAPTVHAGP